METSQAKSASGPTARANQANQEGIELTVVAQIMQIRWLNMKSQAKADAPFRMARHSVCARSPSGDIVPTRRPEKGARNDLACLCSGAGLGHTGQHQDA